MMLTAQSDNYDRGTFDLLRARTVHFSIMQSLVPNYSALWCCSVHATWYVHHTNVSITHKTIFFLDVIAQNQNSENSFLPDFNSSKLRSHQSCSSRTLPQQLHCLPIKHRIDFKIANITFRTLHYSGTDYLCSSLHACHTTRSLRLSNTNRLCYICLHIIWCSQFQRCSP